MTDNFRNYDAPTRPQRVSITWSMETPQDDCGDAPDKRDEGFWPSHDKNAAGYVLPENFDKEQRKATRRMNAWKRGDWYYIGVVAVAHVSIPIGNGSFVTHEFRSAGLWGIEDSAGDYLKEVYAEEKDELLSQLKALGAALQSGEFDQSDK